MRHDRVPALSDISSPPLVICSDEPVHALLALFQAEQDLRLVPVMGENGYLDCVSRKALLNLMTRPFAREIYQKKAISTIFEALPGALVVMVPDVDVNAAAIQLLSVDPTLQTDAFPLVEEGRCVGIVAVSDLMLAVAEEQKRLLGELDVLSSRIREEVALGKKIQQDLLPLSHQTVNGIMVAGGMSTSSEIGGDFFDYFAIGAGKLGVLIADVSGHGVQAGMVTTAAKASLHTLLAMGVTTPAELLSGMNKAILQTARQTLLMTCLIACIDTDNDTLIFANAGHNFPYLLRPDTAPQMLDTAVGFPLGFERQSSYQESCIPFAPGDGIFLYTDGIVECVNCDGEEFGYERLVALLEKEPHLSAANHLHEALMAGAACFAGKDGFEDDVTTVWALREKKGGH